MKNEDTEKQLQELQAEYLATRDIWAYQQIFSIILPYARSQVLKKTRNKIYLPPDLVDNYALEATVRFMSQYEKPKFMVNTSFGGALDYKVREAMYGPQIIKADAILSLNEHIESHKSTETELGEMSESFNFTYLFRADSDNIGDDPANYLFNKEEDAIHSMLSVMTDLYFTVDLLTFVRVAQGIILFIRKSRSLQKYIDRYLDENQKEVFELTKLEMRNRLMNEA